MEILQNKRLLIPTYVGNVCCPKTNAILKPTVYTTCIHLEAPNVCMWYIVLVIGSHWF